MDLWRHQGLSYSLLVVFLLARWYFFGTFGWRFRIQLTDRCETYSASKLYLSRFVAGLLLRQLRIFAAAVARPTPLGVGNVPKKRKSLRWRKQVSPVPPQPSVPLIWGKPQRKVMTVTVYKSSYYWLEPPRKLIPHLVVPSGDFCSRFTINYLRTSAATLYLPLFRLTSLQFF